MLATFVYVAVAVVPPVAGWLSDRARRRGGDRRRETALALCVDVLAIGAMAFAASVGALGAALVAATIAITAAQTIYQALLPEVVPRDAWGTSSGARGVMTLAGTVLGLLAAALLPPQARAVRDGRGDGDLGDVARRDRCARRRARRQRRTRRCATATTSCVTLFARGWIVLGMTLLNTYVLYFFSDVLGARDASLKTGLVAGSALVGAIVSSVFAGKLSDRIDKRFVVALSGVPMTLAALGFALVPAPQPDLRVRRAVRARFRRRVRGRLGARARHDPGARRRRARPRRVGHALELAARSRRRRIGGWIIAHGATPADGYRWLFASAGLCFAIGSLVVLRVGHKPLASSWSTLLVALTCAIRQPLIALRVRVRQWGRLPRRRGPALLIANHQHEDESEIVVERTFLQGPWRPAFTASSRRMYEPGFFATRMPWLAPLMRGVNAGPLFVALGMLPLENELAVRPLRSLAYAVHARHGDLPLDAVFRDEALAPRARRAALVRSARAGARSPRARRACGCRTCASRIAPSCSPRRARGIAEDIARIAGVVRRGATFFVTPEGFYSTDGRMRPLKGIVERLAPLARVWFAAIAFDPFRGRRLSLLYRVVEPADPNELATSLAAARPVTTSALLAQWLLAVGLAVL